MSESSPQPLKIRRYRSKDAIRLHAIDQMCFPSDVAYSRLELTFYLSQPGSVTFVAEYNKRIVGFALGRMQPDHIAHVLTLDVLPEARRRRIGTLLMHSLHDEFKKQGIPRVMLEVSTQNLAAQCLYRELRYQMHETLRGYYNGREDAYRMVLFL